MLGVNWGEGGDIRCGMLGWDVTEQVFGVCVGGWDVRGGIFADGCWGWEVRGGVLGVRSCRVFLTKEMGSSSEF